MFHKLLPACIALAVIGLSIYTFIPTHGGTRADFSYVNPWGIHTLDPARMSWTQDFRIALNIWEGLTTWNPRTLEPVAGAADFPPKVSPDGLTYTFTIRENARWSNGDPVSAHDFVRGWRRGMEPGTATDYTFLFANNLAGAQTYIQWRRENIGALTALNRLRDGWGVSADQARAIVRHPLWEAIRGAAQDALIEPTSDDDESTWRKFAQQLRNGRMDWEALYEQAFQAHVADLDARFDDVGISAPNGRTLIVQLARRCPFFLDLIALPIFLPCHESVELLRERYKGSPLSAQGLVVYDPQWTKPDYRPRGYPGLVTNGPYRVQHWTFKRRVRLAVNPYYPAADTIACRTVDMLVYENISAAIMAYEAGDVDFLPAMDVPYDHEIARLARSGQRPDFHLCRALATYFLNFNCVSKTVNGQPNPFVDRQVRKAFSLAVDKVKIVENVLKRGDRVARSFVPPGAIPAYDPPGGLKMDRKTARRLLEGAGFPGGNGMPVIDLLYIPTDERVCQALARMWEEALGVHVELRAKESKTFAEDKANHRFMVARGNWYADYNDPTTFLDCLTTHNGNNDSGYANPRYDALLADANEAHSPGARGALLKRAEAMIVEEDFPILPILHYAVPIAIKPYVKGLYPNARLWFPFRYVTVTR